MYLSDIKYEKLFGTDIIVVLKVRGKKEELEKFFSDIQDFFDLAHDEWDDEYAMLTLTFDKKSEEGQTINKIREYTKTYIEMLK